MSAERLIREIGPDEFPRAWPIFRVVIAGGNTYSYPPDLTEDEARALWTTPPSRCFLAERAVDALGVYMLRPNQPGLGDHVANCGCMVSPQARGQGIASAVCEHSLAEARRAAPASARCSTTLSSAATKARCACGIATASPSSAACRARSATRRSGRSMCS